MIKHRSLCILLLFLGISLHAAERDSIRILVLSGSNNHDWKSTSARLIKMYSEAGLFSVDVTTKPDTLNYSSLKNYDAVVSNWNSWPNNNLRWPESTEKGLLDFVKNGGGLVTFHASSSAFYAWKEFKTISTSAWIDSTWHGTPGGTKVLIENSHHPITKGLTGFYTHDELWVNSEKNDRFEVLAQSTNADLQEKGIQNQAVILVSEYGKGRIFHNALGHDAKAMRNTGFITLMLRGTEWAATGRITQKIPQELRSVDSSGKDYHWEKTDTTYALLDGENIVWKYNFNNKYGKPFFDPIYLGKNNLTCVEPDDHPWHLGQWFCWKFINGVNYWEYQPNTLVSEGSTEIKRVQMSPGKDFSAELILEIAYHPIKGEEVLSETRIIKISPPQENRELWMDYHFEFQALADEVLLDRTPILGQPNGMSWGGYSGLSIRFNQSLMDASFISSWGDNENLNGQNGDWLYMGFTGIDGNRIGTQMMISPQSKREGAGWYAINTPAEPFYYFSPAYIYVKPLSLKKGESFNIQYRILHIAGEVNKTLLESKFEEYSNNKY